MNKITLHVEGMNKELRDAIELVLEYVNEIDTMNSEEWVESAWEAGSTLETLMEKTNEGSGDADGGSVSNGTMRDCMDCDGVETDETR